jgi:apolipoprotein D and lipocalin family protein
MHLDDDYEAALVGTPDRDGLWLLSRSPQLPEATLEAMQALAQRHGFDTSRWLRVPQGDPQPQP